jgi:hypothetical protein
MSNINIKESCMHVWSHLCFYVRVETHKVDLKKLSLNGLHFNFKQIFCLPLRGRGLMMIVPPTVKKKNSYPCPA